MDCAEALEHVRAEDAALLHEAFLADHMQRLEPHCRRERIAAEGRAVRAGREDVHDLPARYEGGHRQHAPAERLAQDYPVRPDTFVLKGKPGAGAAKTGLHLVENEQHAVRIADSPQSSKPSLRWYDDARLALDRFDQHGGGLRRDCALERGEIAERHHAEAGCERSKTIAILGLGRKRDNGRGTAVEIALRNDDLGSAVGNSLDPDRKSVV